MSPTEAPPPHLASLASPIETHAGLDAALLAEIETLREQTNALSDQIEPLVAARARLLREQQAAWDLLGESASTDDGLVEAYRHDSTAAHTRLRDAVRVLHPYLSDLHWWQPTRVGNPLDRDDTTQWALSAHLYLDAGGERTLDPQEAEALAEALLGVAARFGPDQHTLDQAASGAACDDPRLGMVKVDILDRDCSQTRSLEIWHTLGGERALLVNALYGSGDVMVDGDLVTVCVKAIRVASEPTPGDE